MNIPTAFMENDLFVKLLKLYRNSSEKTPTEDFTADFISSDRQDQEITNWFLQHMETFRKFKEATPELEW
ncbi:MAG: hypothetical protein F6K35_07685 [Okeania sp. SIO2H7]|nr:hypothetical protein [Okeania sp. SIO2H7]